MVDEVYDADVARLEYLFMLVSDGEEEDTLCLRERESEHSRKIERSDTFVHCVIDVGTGTIFNSVHSSCKEASLSAAPTLSMLEMWVAARVFR